MKKSLTRLYHQIPRLGRSFLKIVFFLGISIATFKFIYADNIPFENSLLTIFPWVNTGYYSNAHFAFGGNDFAGIIFWQTGEALSIPETITINGGAQSIDCSTHLRGIYYNNQRGRRIRPLDTGNLALLSGSILATGYETMTLVGGFYTNCTGNIGYTPGIHDVYGQIDHTFGTQTGRMIAGVMYDFTGNIISGTIFDHTLTTDGGVYTGYMFDTYGGIAELSMNMPWCQNFESSPSAPPAIAIAQGSGMSFTCYGRNISGYILRIYPSGSSGYIYQNQVATHSGSYTRFTGASLATGDYLANCTVLGPDDIGPQCGSHIYFHVGTGEIPQSTGCNPDFQGEISFSSRSGSKVITPSLGTYYTNTTGIMLQLGATEPTNFLISGHFIGTPLSGQYTGHDVFNTLIIYPLYLANINTWNNFSSTYTTGICTYLDAAKRVYVDTQSPTSPSLMVPGAYLCSSTPLTLMRSASIDSGAGLSHYAYEIYNNSGMVTGLMLSGTTTMTGISLSIASLPLGAYYARILAIDNVGMSSYSNIVSFISSPQYCPAGTGVMIVTPTIWLRNVDLDKVYRSDPILILGLTGPTLVNISKGMLFINDGTGLGTTGIVTSHDTIYIEVVSSDTYDTTVTSEIHVLGLTGTFSVTTKKSNCILSAAEKLTIQNIYAELKDEYDNDLSKLSEFLNTFQSMAQDESAFSDSCTLEYLLSLIDNDLNKHGGIDTSNHITPNCKEYSIGYDTTQQAYYAPEMINRYYFINRESLIRHLDYYNPGDCHINTYGNNFRTPDTSDPMKHIAPNGKIYHLIGQYGGFSATEFASPKYFDSMESIIRYIDLKNPPKEIWKHTIDTSFTPIVFAAPNGREYRIYKTDRGFMSYKLMKVKYYPTLSELKNHININNPSKR